MKHATDVRGSALIAGEVTMLRSQADVKFDTGDKEESGCLSANLARGLLWVLVPPKARAEGPDCACGSQTAGKPRAGEEGCGVRARPANKAGNAKVVMGQWWGEKKALRLYFQRKTAILLFAVHAL